MCQFKSAICLKDRVYVPDHDHHSDMLTELGIVDDYLHASKTFVRVELSPTDGDKTSDVYGWKLKVDQDITPDWWDDGVDAQRIKDAVKEWCDKYILREGTHEVKEGIWYASGSATVKASGSATVKASGSATVKASGSATVYAYDSATVYAYDSATVYAYDSATVYASGSATVKASGSATVYASGSATVKASGSATVYAFGSATVKASGSATVKASGSATVYAYGSATVYAYDSATVYAFGSATVKASGSATVKASGSATVYASGSATVILPKYCQTNKPVQLSGSAICINHLTRKISSPVSWEVETV